MTQITKTKNLQQFGKINLTMGYTAIVDKEDLPLLSRIKWQSIKIKLPSGKEKIYARHSFRQNGVNKQITMPQLILGLANMNKKVIDHINGNTLDNRKSNIRKVNYAQNSWNRDEAINSKWGKGIDYCKDKKKFRARIMKNGKRVTIGYFHTQNEAISAHQKIEKNLYHNYYFLRNAKNKKS